MPDQQCKTTLTAAANVFKILLNFCQRKIYKLTYDRYMLATIHALESHNRFAKAITTRASVRVRTSTCPMSAKGDKILPTTTAREKKKTFLLSSSLSLSPSRRPFPKSFSSLLGRLSPSQQPISASCVLDGRSSEEGGTAS